jgi:uncharacterized protein (TIRG00374 family)
VSASVGRAAPPDAARYIIYAVLIFGVGLAIAALGGGGAQTLRALHAVPASVLPTMLALSATNYVMRAARWLVFSRALHVRVPPASNALYYVAGFALTTTPGKLGEGVRLWLMNRSHGSRYEDTAALLVADRLSDAVAVSAVVALTVGWFAHYVWMAAASVAIVAAIVGLAMRPSLLLAITDTAYRRLHRWPRLFVRARRAIRALERLASPRVFGLGLLLGMLGWCAEAASFSLLLHVLGVGLHPLSGAFIFAFGMMVGAISVLPGGLGSTEATMIGLLASQGVPFATALVATGVVRLTTLWFAVGLGVIALPLALGRRGVARAADA